MSVMVEGCEPRLRDNAGGTVDLEESLTGTRYDSWMQHIQVEARPQILICC